MDTAAYYLEKARQCRRLTRATDDERVFAGLTALAEEFDAKAKAAQASPRTVDLLGDGTPGRIVPNESGEPTRVQTCMDGKILRVPV